MQTHNADKVTRGKQTILGYDDYDGVFWKIIVLDYMSLLNTVNMASDGLASNNLWVAFNETSLNWNLTHTPANPTLLHPPLV